jgi:hypothetical protein
MFEQKMKDQVQDLELLGRKKLEPWYCLSWTHGKTLGNHAQ